MRKWTRIIGLVSSAVLLIGMVLKQFHLPGAAFSFSWAVILYVLVFTPMFLIDKISLETRREAKISYLIFFASAVVLMTSFQFSFLHIPGGRMLGDIGILLLITYMLFFS